MDRIDLCCNPYGMTPKVTTLELRRPAGEALFKAWASASGMVIAVPGALVLGLQGHALALMLGAVCVVVAPVGCAVALAVCVREIKGEGLDRAGVMGVHAYVGFLASLVAALLVGLSVPVLAMGGGVFDLSLAVAAPIIALAFGAPLGVALGMPLAILGGWVASHVAFRPVALAP